MIRPDHPDAVEVFRAAWLAADEAGQEGSRVAAGLKALADGTPDGRFEGDLLARLDHDPIESKPFRVSVWGWNYSYNLERFGWFAPHGIFGEWEPVKEFRHLDKAVAYLYKVRASAETARLSKVVRSSAESRREVLS